MTTEPAEASLAGPMTLSPIFKEKVWGGRTLARLGLPLPGDDSTPIGEAWMLADLGQTAASGGGGEAARSPIAAGPWAGHTLREVIEAAPRALLGELPLNEQGAFPLLMKFLDARQNLSVQVHPSEQYAAAHPEAHLKSEAWYIVDAEPGAVIYKGVKEGVTPEQFRAALENDALEPLLIETPVKPGECHYLPSGTCHALGAGVVVAEAQTPSDTTFRVYDWGRTGRTLHVEEAMQCIHFGPPEVTGYELNQTIEDGHASVTRLVRSEYFEMTRYAAAGGLRDAIVGGEPRVWLVLNGGGRITTASVTTELSRMQAVLLPADLQDAQLELDRTTTWLEVTFPQAEGPSFD